MSGGEELQLIRDQIRRFVDKEIKPFAAQWEVDRRLPAALFRRMGELGFLGLSFPEEYGGAGLDARASIVLNEELARSTYGSIASSVGVHINYSAPHLLRFGSDEQRTRYLPDIIAGKRICALGRNSGLYRRCLRYPSVLRGPSWRIR